MIKHIDKILIKLAQGAISRESKRAIKEKGKKCSLANCACEAVMWIKWGVHVQQEANVCQKHLREIWDSCSGLVMANICFWQQDLVRNKDTNENSSNRCK